MPRPQPLDVRNVTKSMQSSRLILGANCYLALEAILCERSTRGGIRTLTVM